jgi:hypothetical protein
VTVAVRQMTERDAHKLTESIRVTAVNYRESRGKLMELVQDAKDGSAHLALGYASWTAYLAEVLGEEPMRLARDERQDMVRALSAEGMSTRAIAPIVGASQKTVDRDIRGESFDSPEPEPPTEYLDTAPGEITDSPAPITGMDGKQYTRPEPADPPKVKRRPITDQSSDAGWEIRKATEKLQRIFEDDRLGRNKDEVATHLRGHLMYAVETLQSFLDTLNSK